MSGDERPATPVTIVTGFLGSGKTTLLRHILSGDHGKKIAVIQNELAAETGIEAPTAKGVTGPNGEVFADWVELANGCVCCSVRDDLVSALEVLVKREGFDNILIETTGLADPGPLASVFWLDDALDSSVQLDAIVTIIDSKYCLQHLDEKKNVGEVNECARQIAFADRLIINKTDMVSAEDREVLTKRIRAINPEAPLQESQYSRVPLDCIIGVGAFDVKHAAEILGQHNSAPSQSGHGQDHGGHGHGHGHDHGHSEICEVCVGEPEERKRQLHPKHGDQVGTVTLTVAGELDLQRFKTWLGTFLWEDQVRLSMETYRYKGLLSIKGEKMQHVLQGVHDTFDIDEGPTPKPTAAPSSKFVFIGKGLDRSFLEGQLKSLAEGKC